MIKRPRRHLLIFVLAISFLFLTAGRSYSTQLALELSCGNGSCILIKDILTFGSLQLPPVLFPHDKHTRALGTEKKDCLSCHPHRSSRLIYKFKKERVRNSQEAKQLFHGRCIGCHQQRSQKGHKAGPLDGACRNCHRSPKNISIERKAFGFDKYLHYKHIENFERKCSLCHHQYDEKLNKLVHRDKQELGCRACHSRNKAYTGLASLSRAPAECLFKGKGSPDYKKTGKPFSWKHASHFSCVQCHVDNKDDGAKSGPVQCRGCHSQQGQSAVQKPRNVPLLSRGQPNATLIIASEQKLREYPMKTEEKRHYTGMKPVLFDHARHEKANDTCRVCHHEHKLRPCSSCHSIQPGEAGGYVSLETAMHNFQSRSSCRGCHRKVVLKTRECSGCHRQMGLDLHGDSDDCVVCHLQSAPSQQYVAKLSRNKKEDLAQEMLDKRSLEHVTYSLEDIAENITIDTLENLYGPVDFPHGQIVRSLLEKLQDKPLSAVFHSNKGTFCKGCHHNSPASRNPPSCSSCHTQPFIPEKLFRPGLKAAYHAQCMDCHTYMHISDPLNTACEDCHRKKKDNVVTDFKYKVVKD